MLLVDYDPRVRRAGQRALTHFGCHVELAASGQVRLGADRHHRAPQPNERASGKIGWAERSRSTSTLSPGQSRQSPATNCAVLAFIRVIS